eukprot:IDg2622t1
MHKKRCPAPASSSTQRAARAAAHRSSCAWPNSEMSVALLTTSIRDSVANDTPKCPTVCSATD